MNEIQGISNVLAIRFARLGDIALLLPSLAYLKSSFPDARVSLLTGSRCAPLAELCPQVDEVIPVDRLAMRDGAKWKALVQIRRLIADIRSRKFDLVVDFHSFRETNLLAWMSGARYRVGMQRSDGAYLPFCFNVNPVLEDKGLHVADMFRRVAEHVHTIADGAPVGTRVIEIPADEARRVMKLLPSPPVVVLYVGASVSDRRWASERFAAVADYVIRKWSASVLIVAGASFREVVIAEETKAAVRETENVKVLTDLGIAELAALFRSVEMLISNDSGPMHIGSAVGVPTLGIFSRSLPEHYRPVGSRDRYIKKDSVEEVSVEEVVQVLEEMRTTAGPDRRL